MKGTPFTQVLIDSNVAAYMLSQIILKVKEQILKFPSTNITPGLFIYTANNLGQVNVNGITVDVTEMDDLLPFMENILIGYAEAKTMVLYIIFGALADVKGYGEDDPEETMLGFIARGMTIDGRSLSCFLPLKRGIGDTLYYDVEQVGIELDDADGFSDTIMARLIHTYIVTYNRATREDGEVMH